MPKRRAHGVGTVDISSAKLQWSFLTSKILAPVLGGHCKIFPVPKHFSFPVQRSHPFFWQKKKERPQYEQVILTATNLGGVFGSTVVSLCPHHAQKISVYAKVLKNLLSAYSFVRSTLKYSILNFMWRCECAGILLKLIDRCYENYEKDIWVGPS